MMMAIAPKAEPVRLVIWDLDETFWFGTLTEGGITYRPEVHAIVLELARRGIVSAICSKNDIEPVRRVLEEHGIWDSFVFPSLNWESKGPRLAAMVEAVQLRAPTILFIDDNPMNRAEALHFVPGIQVADETIIPALLDNPLLQGKDDRALTRLAQYKLLERRKSDEVAAGPDTSAFLRESNIRVSIEHDLELHLDRAIELINRTNQLNFTKLRLPEDIGAARDELRQLLSGYTMQAGIIRVRDNYGDYGYCGLYVLHSGASGLRLRHFTFSCRILNMGVETWLYNQLGRPALRVVGDVLTDVLKDRREIDWITAELPEAETAGGDGARMLDFVYARGGCDLHAVTHYFNTVADDVYRAFNETRNGANMRFDHSMFVRYALQGINPEARRAFRALGYEDADFAAAVPPVPEDGRAAWVLSFWADADFALYRHRPTGQSVPLSLPGMQTNQRNVLLADPGSAGDLASEEILRAMRKDFEYIGMIDEQTFKENVRMLLARAGARTPVFVLMANDMARDAHGREGVPVKKRRLNSWVREVTASMPNVDLIEISNFVQGDKEMITHNHFDRMVYFRVFQHIMRRLAEGAAAAQGAAA